jgi:hypothetical protein
MVLGQCLRHDFQQPLVWTVHMTVCVSLPAEFGLPRGDWRQLPG